MCKGTAVLVVLLALNVVFLSSCAQPTARRNLLAKDLSNCMYEPGSWTLEDGVLFAKERGHIWTKDKYGDFILDLEFKTGENVNSGVLIRTADIENWLQTSIEVQIIDWYRSQKAEVPRHDCGAIHDCLAPSKKMVRKPDEWNSLTIVAQDNWIKVTMNGEQIIDMDLNLWTEAHKNPDGTENKFDTARKDMSRVGHIGFFKFKGPVWYRNIKIKTLGAGLF